MPKANPYGNQFFFREEGTRCIGYFTKEIDNNM